MPRDPRQYARITVDQPASRKLEGADARTKYLDIVAVLWSVQNLTDGEINPTVVCAIAGVPPKHGRDLQARDRWHNKGHHCAECPQPRVAGNVVVHDFLKHQDSAETIKHNRDEKAKAGRLANHLRWKHVGPLEECPKCSDQ